MLKTQHLWARWISMQKYCQWFPHPTFVLSSWAELKCRIVLLAHYLIFAMFSRSLKFHTSSKCKHMNYVISLWGNLFHEARKKQKQITWHYRKSSQMSRVMSFYTCSCKYDIVLHFTMHFTCPWWFSDTEKWNIFRIHLTKNILTALKMRLKNRVIFTTRHSGMLFVANNI